MPKTWKIMGKDVFVAFSYSVTLVVQEVHLQMTGTCQGFHYQNKTLIGLRSTRICEIRELKLVARSSHDGVRLTLIFIVKKSHMRLIIKAPILSLNFDILTCEPDRSREQDDQFPAPEMDLGRIFTLFIPENYLCSLK